MPNIRNNISFGLVNIPVLLNPVIHNNDTSFNQLHKKCLNRITYQKYCPHCKVPLKESDIVKGYQYEKDEYLEFTKQELLELKPENDGEINIIGFVSLKEIDPCYFEKSYFLVPPKKSKAYTLFYKALGKMNMVALCKTVLHNKFYYAILRVHKEKIVLTTLYFEEELQSATVVPNAKIEAKELELAIKLMKSMVVHYEPQNYKDEYQEAIRLAIKDKLNGKKVKKRKNTTKKQVDDLMKALEKSLKK